MINKIVAAVLRLVEDTQDYRPSAYRVVLGTTVKVVHVPSGQQVSFRIF